MTIYSDADGVIAIYEMEAYRPKNPEETPPFLIKDGHYFLTPKPDKRIIDAYEILQKQYGVDIHIITNIMDSDIGNEHREDKIAWIQKYMPFIDINTHLSIITEPKYQAVQKIKKKPLDKYDILISDFNKDLHPWVTAGGYGIKYLNGINDPSSFEGDTIPIDMTSQQIAEKLINLVTVKGTAL